MSSLFYSSNSDFANSGLDCQYTYIGKYHCVLCFCVSIGGTVEIDPTIYIPVSKIITSQPTERHNEHHND